MMVMEKLLTHTARGDKSAMLVSEAEQGQETRYQRYIAELYPLLPADTRDELERRSLIVAPRDIGLVLARLKAARLKREDLRMEIEV